MGRSRVADFRIGKNEKKEVAKIDKALKAFKLHAQDAKHTGEVRLNQRLLKRLRKVVGTVEGDRKKNDTTLVTETFRPDLAVPRTAKGHPLLAIECKKLRGAGAKKAFKEALSQGLIYLARYKVVYVLLYDFTYRKEYWKHFWKGNRLESRMAARLRRDIKLRIVVLKP